MNGFERIRYPHRINQISLGKSKVSSLPHATNTKILTNEVLKQLKHYKSIGGNVEYIRKLEIRKTIM